MDSLSFADNVNTVAMHYRTFSPLSLVDRKSRKYKLNPDGPLLHKIAGPSQLVPPMWPGSE